MIFNNNLLMAAGSAATADLGNDIANSTVFNDDDSQYFSRAFTGADSLKTFCIHIIFKRGNHGLTDTILVDTGTTGTKNRLSLQIDPLDRLVFIWGTQILVTANKLRDTGWYHVTLRCDSTQVTATDRASIEINNVEATYTTDNRAASMAQNSETAWGESGATGYIGAYSTPSNYWDGYMSRHYYIDGDDSVVFGRYSTTHTTVWVYSAPSPTYGTDGHKLAFENGGNLGDDTSGNTNDWTNNGSITQSTDTPTKVWPTFSPIDKHSAFTPSEGNTSFTVTNTAGASMRVTTPFPTTGKWYYEMRNGGSTEVGPAMCAGSDIYTMRTASQIGILTGSNSFFVVSTGAYRMNNSISSVIWNNTTTMLYGICFDADTGEVWIRDDGGYVGDPAAGTGADLTLTASDGPYYAATRVGGAVSGGHLNMGQNGTFNGNETAGGNADDNGEGDFFYDVPAGFLAVNSTNIPVLADIGGIDKPYEHFKAIARLGDATADASTVDDFNPVAVAIKNRDQADEWKFVDQVRGATKELNFDSTNAESTDANGVTAFGTNSYTLGTGAGGYNDNAENFIDYLFDGNGAGVANSDGTISSTVSVSPSGAWSFGTWTGTGAAGTVGHGLPGAPEWYAVRNLTDVANWLVGSTFINGEQFLELAQTSAAATNADKFSAYASSTVLNLGLNNEANGSGDAMFFMAFRSVPGLCKVGGFEGNGNADGTYVDCGFRPAYIEIKSVDSTSSWHVYDNVREGYNADNDRLALDSTAAEGTADEIDITSTGFKLRIATDPNVAETYIFRAVAHSAIGGGIPFPNAV